MYFILKSKSEVKYVAFEHSGRNRYVEINTRIPNISKARKKLSYKPKFDLEHSIRSIAEST